MRDFFISYNKADRDWARWIAGVLEEAEYTTFIQDWDFRPGMNFILEMNKAAAETKRTIAVLSPSYLAALFTSAEWSAVLARDPGGRNGTLLPVRVAHCELPPAFAPIAYCDLVELGEKPARVALLAAAKPGRAKPAAKSPFPGKATARATTSVAAVAADPIREAARALADVLATGFHTFQVQARLRNQLVARVRKRLSVNERLQYEAFFHKYFDRMDAEELRLHAIMRGYTENALSKYNARALRIAKQNPALGSHLPSLEKLKKHLNIWLAKYQSVFTKTPSMCLLYVGVEEKTPFPRHIDGELRDYLAGKPGRSTAVPKRTAAARVKRPATRLRRTSEEF